MPGSQLRRNGTAVTRTFAAALLSLLGLAAQGEPLEAGIASEGANPESVALRIMSFNIEWGGTHVRFASIVEAIRASGAGIVGVQEPEGNLARLAGDLGWHYDRRNYVISEYPVIDPPDGGGRYLLIEVRPGKVVAMGNVHLPTSPSGDAWLLAGRTPAQVVAMEREVRVSRIEPFLEPFPKLTRQGLPVFLSGDFNAPSHQDWTEATVGKFAHRDEVVPWPVTLAVVDAGLRDSFRDIHKNPVTHPGFTWWAARPQIADYNPTDTSRRSRIDFIWYGGGAKVTNSRLAGEAGAPGVAFSVTPWPSDHRAVVSDFEVTPAPMPVLVAAEQRVHTSGNPLRFAWRNRTARGSLVIERHGGEIVTERRIALDSALGHLQLPDNFLSPGAYHVVLHDENGIEASRNEFWIVAPDARPKITIAGHRFASGDSLPVNWRNGPGNRYDWIGIFKAAPAETRNYAAWAYVGAKNTGETLLTSANAEEGWPLAPGTYVARFLLDDGYAVLAESEPFIID